jgi:hypothetical protein
MDPGCEDPVAVPALTGRVRGPPVRRSRWQDRACGQKQPVLGGEDDLGGGAHGATLGEVAADGAALVGDRQVQVGAVRRQGAGEPDDLERALPGGVFGAAGEPQPDS